MKVTLLLLSTPYAVMKDNVCNTWPLYVRQLPGCVGRLVHDWLLAGAYACIAGSESLCHFLFASICTRIGVGRERLARFHLPIAYCSLAS